METLKTMDHHAGNLAQTEETGSETQGPLLTVASRILQTCISTLPRQYNATGIK